MINEQTRILALAHLHNGMKPADVGELVGISYASALKLRKELHAAQEKDQILELFKLNEAALGLLMEGVKKQLTPAIEAFGVGELVEEETTHITNGIESGKLLDQEFQDSARALSNKIMLASVSANNADTLLTLSKALCELQRAFFGNDLGAGGSNLPLSTFEQHLRN